MPYLTRDIKACIFMNTEILLHAFFVRAVLRDGTRTRFILFPTVLMKQDGREL